MQPWAVFQTRETHLDQHRAWFLTPAQCKERTVTDIQASEDAVYDTVSEELQDIWSESKELRLPASLRQRIASQAREPLRYSDRMHAALVRDARGGAELGSPSQAAS